LIQLRVHGALEVGGSFLSQSSQEAELASEKNRRARKQQKNHGFFSEGKFKDRRSGVKVRKRVYPRGKYPVENRWLAQSEGSTKKKKEAPENKNIRGDNDYYYHQGLPPGPR